ncbi:saccharopine dehydrogenase NADP-binding domain-containing protein [Desulfovibrio inopinatus]|uniref:saccharopine dehydrogenase NADP-binding domain-containing protein n=1 Tax=Desulfovibrio inopinatus TaxID=102109 RepID=UPI0004191C6F|nr:saccharopine dehydrogenase NADP-binding domain-containing protein [Desulfovibrio inopinatus]
MSTVVGVLGGAGAIGTEAVDFLLRYVSDIEVLVLGRSSEKLTHILKSHKKNIRTQVLDCSNILDLRKVLQQCSVICNCAGPSSVLGPCVAKEALRAEVPYVDPAGEAPLLAVFERPEHYKTENISTVVLGSGLMPGLSGLVPLWLYQHLQEKNRPSTYLRIYYAALDAFSYSAAYDYAESMRKAPPPESTAARPHFVEMPFSGQSFLAFAYTSFEIRRVRERLNIPLDFHNCFIGEEMPRALATIAKTADSVFSLDDAATVLKNASGACASRYGRGHFFLCEAEGDNGQKTSLAVAVDDANTFMGAMVGMAVEAILSGQVRGVNYFAEALPPKSVMTQLARQGLIRMGPPEMHFVHNQEV